MNFNKEKITITIFFIVQFVISVLLLCFYKLVNFSLFLGFLIGSSISYLNYFISDYISLFFITKTKRTASFISFCGFLFRMVIICSIIILIIYINKYNLLNKKNLFNKNIKLAYSMYPINIISFLFGTEIYKISIFLSSITKKKINK
ncbi:Uncharacterised protein [Mycoplasmopsis maculosa]|uniref:Uncharacterized protein n=1 Tax=Mycoplasmopsis maculosa TaxID=114885 RepID=A0A449B3J8_9BACT|nr:ATP synthase subunit I [Mycoplasmopsis maculosa]VEU75156.1 Uncharacterised protein [Mycoplasmopsis maculosa]